MSQEETFQKLCDALDRQVKRRDEVPGILPPHNLTTASDDVTEAVRKVQQERENRVEVIVRNIVA